MNLRVQPMDRKMMREMNQNMLLNLIRAYAPVSRTQLKQLSGLSLGTIVGITATLMEQQLVVETGMAESTGGRKAGLLEISPEGGYMLGIDLREHDIRFEEDNWESPTLGAWGIGWQVLLDGLEITQFTYFQQSGGLDLDPISVELTYGLERICALLQGKESVYDLRWSDDKTYGDIRLAEEQQFSAYSFDRSDAKAIRSEFDLHEKQAKELLDGWPKAAGRERQRYPLLATYDHCLKCSHLFNLMDARGVISTTERAALMGRVRTVACRTATAYLEQLTPGTPKAEVRL